MSCRACFYRSLFYLHAAVVIFEFFTTASLISIIIFVKRDLFVRIEHPDESDLTLIDMKTLIIFGALLAVAYIRTIIFFIWLLFVSMFSAYCCCLFLSSSCRHKACKLIQAKSTHRCISFNCNCPCYRPRPQLRFVFQFLLVILVFGTRVTIIIFCVTLQHHPALKSLAVVVSISVFFLILTALLDFYHYHVWWHYKPDFTGNDIKIPGKPLSSKHKRYLPYELLGNNRTQQIGDKLCTQEPCTNRKLEHILIFHLSDYQPQPRWSELKKLNPSADVYIGFHRTAAQSAVYISHSDFLPSTKPPQMLGYGIYFARSIENTLGKARFGGAIIAAEVRMGKVKEVRIHELSTVRNTDSWYPEFDTVYYNHDNDTRDEFCVHEPSQVLRWIVVTDEEFDGKVQNYGMSNEFDDTKCSCI